MRWCRSGKKWWREMRCLPEGTKAGLLPRKEVGGDPGFRREDGAAVMRASAGKKEISKTTLPLGRRSGGNWGCAAYRREEGQAGFGAAAGKKAGRGFGAAAGKKVMRELGMGGQVPADRDEGGEFTRRGFAGCAGRWVWLWQVVR
jgi:hypothetical protein